MRAPRLLLTNLTKTKTAVLQVVGVRGRGKASMRKQFWFGRSLFLICVQIRQTKVYDAIGEWCVDNE